MGFKSVRNMNKKMKYIFIFFIISYVTVNANTQIDKAVNSQILFEKQKEQYQKIEENSNKKILFYDTKKPKVIDKTGEECIKIKEIKEDTITLLSLEEKNKIFQVYEGTCRTLTELNNLTKELTTLYIDKGYVTSQVYFEPQNMDKGILKIIAMEGKINEITPNEFYINNAFLGQKGKYLNLRELETAIESINRLPSNKATMKLIPANQVGQTDIQIENKTSNRINGIVSIDNYGSEKTGKIQGNMSLNLDNPLGINDQLSVYLNSTQKHTKKENSKGHSFVYSFPIGNRLLNTLSYKKTSYKQFIKVGITDYETKGNTDTATLNMKYKIFHNQQNRLNIGATVSRYDTKNYIVGSLIETSSYSLSNKSLNFDYIYQTPGFYTWFDVSYIKGTNWFGTHNPTDLDEKFSLYTIDLSVMKQFLGLQYSLNGHYQHSRVPLFGNNQISIGGAYSVRGYNKEGLSGNNGYYIRNELEKKLSNKLFDTFEQKYFIAYDYGYIKEEEDVLGGILASYSLGANYIKDKFSMQVYYAVPIRKNDVSQTNKFFGITMGYRF